MMVGRLAAMSSSNSGIERLNATDAPAIIGR